MSRKPAKKRQARNDAWGSDYVRLYGTKATEHRLYLDPQLDPEQALWMFEQDDFANTIVSAVVEDAMRQGFSWVDEGDDSEAFDAKKLTEACRKWDVAGKVTEGAIWGRCTGAGFIMLGLKTGQPSEPLDDEAIRKGDLLFLDVYDRTDVIPHTYYSSPLDPKFGQVEKYTLQSTSLVGAPVRVVHETRMVKFPGVLTSKRTKTRNNSYDNSALQCIFRVIQQADLNWKSIGALMADFAQGVFKIKNLIKILAQREAGVLEERMRVVNAHRSSERAILLDTDMEDFERKATPVAGAAELLDRTWQRLAAAAKMPMTRLLRQSPAGMNATGESDITLWYDEVGSERTQVIGPRLERLGRIIARAEGINAPEGLCVSFPSLWQMSPTQEAEVRNKQANTDKLYVDAGVLLPEEIALSRWGRGKYSTETTIDVKLREAQLGPDAAPVDDGTTPLTPSTMELILTMNEARAREGLPPIPDGDLTISEYKAKHAETVAAAAAAEAGKSEPTASTGTPPVVPTAPGIPNPDDEEETDDDEV